MAKKITIAEIKKMLKAGSMLIGTERAIKSLKLGKVESVLISSNCPAGIEKNISYYARLNNTEFHKLDCPNEELGIICKKPFSVSVLSFLKAK